MATVVNTRDVILRVAVPRYAVGDIYSEIDAINATLADIASDSKFTTAERQAVRKEWDIVISERKSSATTGIMNLINIYPTMTTEHTAYVNAFQALATYLNGGVAYTVGSLGSIPTPPTWLNDANLASATPITIVASTFRTNWKTLYDARTALINKATELAGDYATWGSITNRPVLYKIRSRGMSDTSAPWIGESFYGGLMNGETGALLRPAGNMYTVFKILRSTGAWELVGDYNILSGSPTGFDVANQMATALNAIDSTYIVAICTFDEPAGQNRLYSNLPAAMYRCGASKAVFGSTRFRYRCAYILIGIPGCGEGNGYEAYSGNVDADTTAWCEASFQVLNGNLIVGSANYTPKIVAGDTIIDPVTSATMPYQDLSTKAGQFSTYTSWNFRNTTDGWSVLSNGIVGATSNALQVTSSGPDPIIYNYSFTPFSGLYYNIVRARVMRLAGSGWDGSLFYGTTARGNTDFLSTYFKNIPNTTVLNQWVVLEWDMESLTAGGTDWITSTISGLRIDLGNSASDAFLIDWIEVGSYAGHIYPGTATINSSNIYNNTLLYSGAATSSISSGSAFNSPYITINNSSGKISGSIVGNIYVLTGSSVDKYVDLTAVMYLQNSGLVYVSSQQMPSIMLKNDERANTYTVLPINAYCLFDAVPLGTYRVQISFAINSKTITPGGGAVSIMTYAFAYTNISIMEFRI